MKQFEYTSVQTPFGMSFLDDLNFLGRDGWELVTVRYARGAAISMLKREIASEEGATPLVKHSHSIKFPCNQSCPFHGTKEEITL